MTRKRKCESCGRAYEARSSRSRFCGGTCQKRGIRANPQVAPAPAGDDGLVGAVRLELEEAGRLESVAGQAALLLAGKMCGGGDTGSGLAALERELRATMVEALQGGVAVGDPLDELKARRDAKRVG